MTRFRVLMALLMMLGAACARDGTLEPGGDGLTRILLTDAPFPFDRVSRVDVFVVSVAATAAADTTLLSGDWVTVADPNTTYNLLDLQRGNTTLVGEGELPAGVYEAVRVVIDVSQSEITLTDGSAAVVDWQGYGQVALHAVVEDPLDVPDAGASIVIDFDVGRSFIPVGGGFVFIPWIRAVNEAATGTLTGTVRGADGAQGEVLPVANASVSVFPSTRPVYNGAVPMATARTDASGEFLLPFVVEGSYTVQVDPPLEIDAGRALMSHVTVSAGTETTLNVSLPDPSPWSSQYKLRIHGKQSLSLGESAAFASYLIEENGDSLPASHTEWYTSNAAIAGITGVGQAVTVTGNGSGLALIFATVEGVSDSLVVSVGGAPGTVASVEVTPTSQSIGVGDSTYVEATVRDENGLVIPGAGVVWSVSDANIASVMGGFAGTFAILWGHAPGTVVVTALAEGKTGSATVVVN
jgi:hypothetical protein